MKETKPQLKERISELERENAFLKGKIAILESLKEPQQTPYYPPIINPVPSINPPLPNQPWTIPQGPQCPTTTPGTAPINPWWWGTSICQSGENKI